MNPIFTALGEEGVAQAKLNLSRFVLVQATGSEQLLGFGWCSQLDAPSQFAALKRAYLASLLTGDPLPISNEHSAETIFISAGMNEAFRFWHDVTHVRMDQGFDLSGEITVALAHLDVLRAAGWGPGSPEHELLRADTLGQALCNEATGKFPIDQPCFVRRAISSSLGKAIRSEPDRAAGADEDEHNDDQRLTEQPAA